MAVIGSPKTQNGDPIASFTSNPFNRTIPVQSDRVPVPSPPLDNLFAGGGLQEVGYPIQG